MSASSDDQAKDGTSGADEVGRCPICGKPRAPDYRPFCSKRCADVDLGRWLHGSYAIPVTEEEDEDGETPVAPERRPARDGNAD